MQYDIIIIGGGLYGLYSALLCGRKGRKVLVLEHDDNSFQRATYVNQARVHMGYHYPRSYSTAVKSAKYFRRFCEDFSGCILSDFRQVYATSSKFSYSNAKQFMKFCRAAGIMCEEIPAGYYFKEGMCDGAFITQEYTYDAVLMHKQLLSLIEGFSNIDIIYGAEIESIQEKDNTYSVILRNGGGGITICSCDTERFIRFC